MSKIKVFAPASVGNTGPCFDRMGLAVAKPGDIVTMEWNDSPEIEIMEVSGIQADIPLDSTKNTAGVVAREVLKLAGKSRGVKIWLEKQIPLSSGLGGSAAGSVAAAVAVNHLLDNKFEKIELLPACRLGEVAACGANHPDNVAPSLLGGLVNIKTVNRGQRAGGSSFDKKQNSQNYEYNKIGLPFNFSIVLVKPDCELSTTEARSVLTDYLEELHKDAKVKEKRMLAAKSFEEFAAVVNDNPILEKARGSLIPNFFKVKEAGLVAGAAAVTISGGGPAVIAFVNKGKEEDVERAMAEAFDMSSQSWITELDKEGARVI